MSGWRGAEGDSGGHFEGGSARSLPVEGRQLSDRLVGGRRHLVGHVIGRDQLVFGIHRHLRVVAYDRAVRRGHRRWLSFFR